MYKPPQMMKKPARSNRMPARIIFKSGTRPEPYTMAFGGVETGSMNPKLAPRHAPRAGGNGLTLAACAMAITTGMIMLAEAVLLAASEMAIAMAIDRPVSPHRELTPR